MADDRTKTKRELMAEAGFRQGTVQEYLDLSEVKADAQQDRTTMTDEQHWCPVHGLHGEWTGAASCIRCDSEHKLLVPSIAPEVVEAIQARGRAEVLERLGAMLDDGADVFSVIAVIGSMRADVRAGRWRALAQGEADHD